MNNRFLFHWFLILSRTQLQSTQLFQVSSGNFENSAKLSNLKLDSYKEYKISAIYIANSDHNYYRHILLNKIMKKKKLKSRWVINTDVSRQLNINHQIVIRKELDAVALE